MFYIRSQLATTSICNNATRSEMRSCILPVCEAKVNLQNSLSKVGIPESRSLSFLTALAIHVVSDIY